MTNIHPDHELYVTLLDLWNAQGQPYKLDYRGVVYVVFVDDTPFFAPIDSADRAHLDPADKSGRWHRYYGWLARDE